MALRMGNPVMKSLDRQYQGAPQQGYQQPHYGQNPAGPGFNPGSPSGQFMGQPQYGAQAGAQYGSSEGMPPQQPFGTAGPSAVRADDRPMTIDDVVTKTGITLAVIILVSLATFFFARASLVSGAILMAVGAIGGLVMVLISVFGKKSDSAVVTLLYAFFEGLLLGPFSLLFVNTRIGGEGGFQIIFTAIAGTIGVFIAMLVVYRTGAIRVTPRFNRILLGCLGGVIVAGLANLVMSLILGRDVMGLYSGGPVAIGFSIICIILAALSFLTDFDGADQLIRAGAPARYAWGVALGLAVTLVWLYTEILRLLSYFSRD